MGRNLGLASKIFYEELQKQLNGVVFTGSPMSERRREKVGRADVDNCAVDLNVAIKFERETGFAELRERIRTAFKRV